MPKGYEHFDPAKKYAHWSVWEPSDSGRQKMKRAMENVIPPEYRKNVRRIEKTRDPTGAGHPFWADTIGWVYAPTP
jgi:hypothetical protein